MAEDLAILDEELEAGTPQHDHDEDEEKAVQSESVLDELSKTLPRKEYGLEGEHKLARSWTFWYNRRSSSSRASADSYTKGVKRIGTFNTIEGFWGSYSHLLRPSDLAVTSDLSFFKEDISPMWEHDANQSGGKWIVRFRKGWCSRYWEELLIALIGEQFGPDDGICGAVMSIRYHEDIISIWNSDAHDTAGKARILADLRRTLRIPQSISLEYKAHDQSLKDGSSFRNTSVVRQNRPRPPIPAQEVDNTYTPSGEAPQRWGDAASRRWVKRPNAPPVVEAEKKPSDGEWRNLKELTPWEAPTE